MVLSSNKYIETDGTFWAITTHKISRDKAWKNKSTPSKEKCDH